MREKLDSGIGQTNSPDYLEDVSTTLINRTIYKGRLCSRMFRMIFPSISTTSIALHQRLSTLFGRCSLVSKMARLTYISLLGLASSVLAAPQPALTGTEGTIASTVRIAGPTAAPNIHGLEIAAAPQFLTITVINSHGDAISTSHAHDPNGPSAVSGNVGPGTMANGATAAFAVPTGWIGNVAINDAGWAITGDDSLIEGNFVVPQGSTEAVADVDVSYV